MHILCIKTDRIAQLVKRSDELQQKLESMAHHFKAYKEQVYFVVHAGLVLRFSLIQGLIFYIF